MHSLPLALCILALGVCGQCFSEPVNQCFGKPVFQCFGEVKEPVRPDPTFSSSSPAKEQRAATDTFSSPKHRASQPQPKHRNTGSFSPPKHRFTETPKHWAAPAAQPLDQRCGSCSQCFSEPVFQCFGEVKESVRSDPTFSSSSPAKEQRKATDAFSPPKHRFTETPKHLGAWRLLLPKHRFTETPKHWAAPPAQTLDQLLNALDQRREQTDQGRDEQLKKLSASYTTALRRLLDRTKASGDLDAVRPVNDEITAIEDGAATLPPLPDSAPAELKKLRATYDDARHKILKTHATTIADLGAKADAALQKLETDLTRAGQIDAALAARRAREELANDQAIADARDFATLGSASGKGKPALQLRRHGDNLEVIVFYDRAGKVSMDSPVENTRERTGDGKELGDTKAKTLGEFVGAKGYTVDPFLAYHQVFEKGEAPGMAFTEIVPAYRTAIGGESGMKLTFKPGAKNPHISLGDLLPITAIPGATRIEVRYFIPKENRTLQGFSFVQYVGGPLAGKTWNTRGSWTSETIEFNAAHDMPRLLFYLARAPGKSVADAAAESVILREIKIEHTRFSAFVQKRIGAEGKPLDEQNDAAKQPLFIANGEIVQKP